MRRLVARQLERSWHFFKTCIPFKPSLGGRRDAHDLLARAPRWQSRRSRSCNGHELNLAYLTLSLTHQADHGTRTWKRWQPAAFLLVGPCRCERSRVAHVVPGGLDPAVGALDWAMRNSSIWPLKGSAMPLTCRPMPRVAEFR